MMKYKEDILKNLNLKFIASIIIIIVVVVIVLFCIDYATAKLYTIQGEIIDKRYVVKTKQTEDGTTTKRYYYVYILDIEGENHKFNSKKLFNKIVVGQQIRFKYKQGIIIKHLVSWEVYE